MKKTKWIIGVLAVLLFPISTLALATPEALNVPSHIDADFYTFTIEVPIGSKVTIMGGPSFVPPATDGAGRDELDGVVEVLVGLAQEQINNFGIMAEREGVFSESISVDIMETSDLPEESKETTEPGDHTAPEPPVIDPVSGPVDVDTYTITGSAEALANISVTKADGTRAGSTRARENGTFQVEVDLERGKTNRFNLSAEDAAGNEGVTAQIAIQALMSAEPQVNEYEQEVITKPKASSYSSVEPKFTDTKGHWAEDYVKDLYSQGVISGKSETTFDPNALLTRAELAKIVINGFGHEVEDSALSRPFTDVSITAWFVYYVAKAKELGIVGGYTDGTFRPNESVTRAGAMKMIAIASGLDTKGYWNEVDFTDVRSSDWFAEYVGFSQAKGIVGGYSDGSFQPGKNITRAEVVKIVSKFMELVE